MATLGNHRGGNGGFGAYYSLVDVIGVLPRCAGLARPRREPGIGDKAPGGRGRAAPPPAPPRPFPPSLPVLAFALRGAAPDRPAGPPACRRCLLEPRPRGAPRPGEEPGPAHSFAVAAGLSLCSVGRRAGPPGRVCAIQAGGMRRAATVESTWSNGPCPGAPAAPGAVTCRGPGRRRGGCLRCRACSPGPPSVDRFEGDPLVAVGPVLRERMFPSRIRGMESTGSRRPSAWTTLACSFRNG